MLVATKAVFFVPEFSLRSLGQFFKPAVGFNDKACEAGEKKRGKKPSENPICLFIAFFITYLFLQGRLGRPNENFRRLTRTTMADKQLEPLTRLKRVRRTEASRERMKPTKSRLIGLHIHRRKKEGFQKNSPFFQAKSSHRPYACACVC